MKHFVSKIKNKMILTTLFVCMVMCMSLFGLSTAVSAENSDDNLNGGFYNGHKYQSFSENLTWSEAEEFCENLGGHLVTITSEEENTFIANTFSSGFYRFGCYAVQDSGEWVYRWITGEAFSYSNMGTYSSPVNADTRGTMQVINNDYDHYIRWMYCPDSHEHDFICEWEDPSTAKPDTRLTSESSSNSLWADPIDTSTGAHVINLSYLTQYGDQTFSFDLSYDSSRLCEGEMGTGWYHNYEKKIEPQSDGTLRYYTTPSTYVEFLQDETGNYITTMQGKENWIITKGPPQGVYYVDLGINGTESYYPSGELRYMKSHTGKYLFFSYGSQSMTVFESVSGKSLTVTYDTQGRISNVSGATPTETGTGSVQFTYDENNHLTAITGPDSKTIQYTYDTEGHVLTGTDGDDVRYFTDTYENGRVVRQVDGDGNTTSFSYDFPSPGNSRVTINDRNENTAVHTFDAQSRLIRNEDQDGNITTYAYDANGNITEETDGNGNKTERTYNNNNQVLTETHPLNQTTYCTTHYTYDSNGNLTHQENPDGGEISYTYRSDNQIASTTDELGNTTTYTYNADDQLIEKVSANETYTFTYEDGKVEIITDSEGGVTSYTYNSCGMPATITDANGNVVSYSYDADGNLVQQTDQEGNETTFTYDCRGNVLSQTDGNGNTTMYLYNGNGKVTSMIDAKNNVTNYTYDGEDWLTETEDPDESIEHRTYTPAGPLETVTDGEGNTTTYTYDGAGNVLTEEAPEGGRTTKTYDDNNNLISERDPANNATAYAYDSMNRLITETNAFGKITTYAYDLTGNLLSITDPLGNTTSYTYDANGNQQTVTDPRGNTTSYTYDGNNNLTSMTDALNNVTTYAYDAAGRSTGMTDAKNHTTTYAYDGAGRITGTTDALGNTTAVGYDANGNITSTTDGRGYTTNYTYDELNLQTSSTDPMNNTTQNTFDSLGRLVGTTTPMGNTTSYSYDENGNMISVTDPMAAVSSQSHDGDGNVTRVTNPNGGDIDYTYDTSDRLTSETTNYYGTITYGYNRLNVLSEYTNGRGQQTTLAYDDAGRITRSISTEDAVSYTYDANGNVLTVRNSEGTVTREYDALNRVTSYTDTQGNTITYTYDEVGNLQTMGYPGGNVVTYTYDAANRMETITDWNGNITIYTYDNAGNLIMTDRPDNTLLTQTYDAAGRLTSMEDIYMPNDAVICQYDFTYDNDGNIIEEASNKTQSLNTDASTFAEMTYDANGRLTQRSVTESQQLLPLQEDTFYFESGGNICGTNNVSITYPYYPHGWGSITQEKDIWVACDDLNTILSYNQQQAVNYDQDGNMTYGPLGQMSYDAQNRLTETDGESYTYDGENNRNSSTANGVTTAYTYDATSSLSRMIMSETGTDRTYYIYGLGLIGSYDSSGDYNTYHYDYRGSTVALIDENGTVTDEYIYDAYGEILQHTGNSDTPFLYNGRDGVMTDDNGLYYMRARYYSPEMKRFVNADPLTQSIAEYPSQNAYTYANGNPISYIDPFGTSATLGHTALDAAGFIPGIGMLFDGMNALWYLAEGDFTNAGLSAVALVPVIGDAAGVVGAGIKIVGKADGVIDAAKVAEKTVFKSQDLLDAHYVKHASEFGNITKDEYLAGAQNLVNSKTGNNILTKTRSNGDVIFYNKTTNEFAIKASDGSIRTYFKPTDGIDYFYRQ